MYHFAPTILYHLAPTVPGHFRCVYINNKTSFGKGFTVKNSSFGIQRGYLFFSVKDRNLFHRVDTIGNIFTRGCATRENITNGVHSMK